MNYLPTLVIFKSAIEKAFPQIKAEEGLDNLPAHLLWMLYEIDNMYDPDKGSRWIGYICRCLEDLKIFNNSQIQFIIRSNDNILLSSVPNEISKNVKNLFRQKANRE